MRHESVLDAIGNTPLVRLAFDTAADVAVYAKLELANPFAMKDRVARQIVLQARATGALAEGAPIIESSSGTMALGLALVGTALGHPVHIVTDPRIDPITRTKLEVLGCRVHVVESMTGAGWQSARLERLARLMSDLDGAFWPRQYSNPDNPAAYRALAAELRADLPDRRLDVLVGAVGSGGSLCGSARVALEQWPELHVVGVDCAGSVLFAQPDRPQRRQSGLGNSLQPDNVDYAVVDEVHWLSDDEAFAATRQLAAEQKIFAGSSSGSVYRVLRHLAEQAVPGSTLVGILPDRGDRYVESVYHCQPTTPIAAEPVEVAYGTAVASWAYARIPRRRRPRLVFVESNTTGTGMIALRTAARLGTAPVLLTGRRDRYAGLAGTPAEVIECDTNDPVALRAAVDTVAARPGGLAGITTTSEFYLVPVAELANGCDLPGNPADAMATCRNKARTRDVLREAAVTQPAYVIVDHPDQVRAAVAEVGLPCLVKPADDTGSNDVLRCDTAVAAEVHAAQILAVTENVRGQPTAGVALVEQYLTGREFSVEMFSLGGRHECVGITAKSVTAAPYFVEHQHVFPAELPGPAAERIIDAAARALKASGIELGATHVELRLTDTDAAIIEINARLAGGMIPEVVAFASGVNLLEQHLRAHLDLPVRLAPSRHRHAGIRFLLAPAAGTLRAIEGLAGARAVPGVASVATTVEPGRSVRPPRNAYDRLGHVVAVADTAGAVEHALAEAVGHIRIDVDEGAG